MPRKPSFFERLTGTIRLDDYDPDVADFDTTENEYTEEKPDEPYAENEELTPFEESAPEEADLSLDMYETQDEIIVRTMCAGVRPEDIEVSITREQITIRGERSEDSIIEDDNFHARELYWGSFSRTLNLPAEVEPEEAEASEKHGLLMIRLPKINKDKQTKVKIKSA